MKRHLLAAIMTVAFTGTASAHTHLRMSTPSDGSTVASPPPEFVLYFSEPATLTALSVQMDGGKEQKIEKLPTDATAQLRISAPKLANGHYTLTYRVVGDDGHVMSGKIAFTVGGKPSPGLATKDTHDDHGTHAGH